MSVLDTNFDSPREMPSRAAWLDNASAALLNDNSYFNSATKEAAPAWLGKLDLFDSSKMAAVASEVAPESEPAPPPETEPAHPPESGPVGPIALEGPPPSGVAHVGETLPGNGPPERTDSTAVAQSRGNRSDADENGQPTGEHVEPSPNQDGRNADGTYGAGHHPYTPPTYYPDNSGKEMTEHDRPALAVEEPSAPVYTPRRPNTAALQALIAAVKRNGGPTGSSQTGVPGDGPGVAHADPNYTPPAGAFGGLRGRRGG